MREQFSGYYAPTDQEYERLWQEGLIALDTNVLLDLYRLPASARDELLAVLELLKDRLWIPYQVALEFQRLRLTVIASERKVTEDALTEANDLFDQIRDRVGSLQIDKRGLGLDAKPLIDGLKLANDKLIEAIESVHKAQLDIAIVDPVRERLDTLLTGKIGPAPANQTDLDGLSENGQERYDNKIPPGFADADKDKNPAEATFYHDSLTYRRKFGDLVLWRQLIRHAKDAGKKVVLLVTSDRKEDWWWRERGKTIGPRPELAREMKREAEVELFWMYSSAQFLENAKRFTQAKVSDLSVSELKEVARLRPQRDYAFEVRRASSPVEESQSSISSKFAMAEAAVRNWLVRRFADVVEVRGFPDFIVKDETGLHGFEVKYVRSLSQMLLSPAVINGLLRGYLEVNEGRLNRLSMVLVADRSEIDEMMAVDRGERARSRLHDILVRYPAYEFLVGYINEEGVFVPVFNVFPRNPWEEEHDEYR